jgi:predicted phosphodiesterase
METVAVRIGIISDVHGNRHAFEAVLDAIEAEGVEELWCLGDLVGYGADPDPCVELAARHAAICLAGNHDLAVRGDIPIDEFSRGAAIAARWTAETMTSDGLDYLRRLEPQKLDEDVGLYHASPRDPIWEYVLSPLQAELCLDAAKHKVSLIGHSHVALAFVRRPGAPASGETRTDGEQIELAGAEWLLNPGSVGQPRDGDPRAAWMLLDTSAWTATYRRTEYDVAAAGAAIRAAKLPDSLAERLAFGQ